MAKAVSISRKLVLKMNKLRIAVVICTIWVSVSNVNEVAGRSNLWSSSDSSPREGELDVGSLYSEQVLNDNVIDYGLLNPVRLLKVCRYLLVL